MEITNMYYIWAGVIAVIVLMLLAVFYKPATQKYKDGIKAANLELLKKDQLFKRKMVIYKGLRIASYLLVGVAVLFTFILLARPYKIKKINQEKYNRDIFLCMDVSTSVDELNKKLVLKLQDTVRSLNGERVGIVMFNTSPVLLSPLTDDYEYTIEQLKKIEEALKANDLYDKKKIDIDQYYDLYTFLYGGTLVDNEERGSSLMGDGLLGAAFNFSRKDSNRTKIIIFSTDNDPYGTALATLPEAAEICRQNKIVVYGIGTKEMEPDKKEEMKKAVESTGGKFYLEEDSKTFDSIVTDIESQSASLIKGKQIIKKMDMPDTYFKYLVFAVIALILVSLILRTTGWQTVLRYVGMLSLLLLFYLMVVVPTMHDNASNGENIHFSSKERVLFVIDDTISMLADDAQSGGQKAERLTQAKEDIENIIDRTEGAQYSVISFHNSASVLTPYTNNSEHVKNVIESIYPLDSLYARGSSLSTAKAVMLENLKQAENTEQKKTYVFFISDGEITNDAKAESFKELAPYIKGGAVLGYGTKQGGKMYMKSYFDDEIKPIMDESDYPYKEAISQINEDNLKQTAQEMGISYVNMNSQKGLNSIVDEIQTKSSYDYTKDSNTLLEDGKFDPSQEKEKEPDGNSKKARGIWYLLLIPFLGLLFWEQAALLKQKQ